MIKNKDKTQECKDKKSKDKENKGGYRELKDPLLGKGKRHSAAALKKDADAISNEGAVVPSGEHKGAQEAVIADLEKKVDDVEIPNKDGESVILRYKDSEKENLLEKIFAYEKMTGTTIPLDYDSDSESFLVSVKKSEIDEFRPFMKDFLEIPFKETADKKIEEIQSKRSNRAIAIDKSITASRVGRKDNPIDLKNWSENPGKLDLLDVDSGEL
ncbi:MAG: hypothetical protein A2W22_04630 [Candidatus Levybacteria bacterium RBG_16_35_11]|nr:MAG: hypothetical protein A2W22_04630 [Candidatus Levybacteria bacterium RBG_16_35_11]